MKFARTKDESLLSFYESVRRQVEEDMRLGGRYRFAADGMKQYAEELRQEMERRRLSKFLPRALPATEIDRQPSNQ
jgi:hypothetical protein